MDRNPTPYLSYLLRLWWEDGEESGQRGSGQGEWRASLQDPHTQEMQVFASPEAMFAFLGQLMTVCGGREYDEHNTDSAGSPEMPAF